VAPSIDVVDGHHHCAVLGVLHHSAPRASAPALEPSRLEVLAELVGPCLPVRAAKVPVFRLAPKQSPPAA
jgi:hypothetical protein